MLFPFASAALISLRTPRPTGRTNDPVELTEYAGRRKVSCTVALGAEQTESSVSPKEKRIYNGQEAAKKKPSRQGRDSLLERIDFGNYSVRFRLLTTSIGT
jgi:hypothetical protein